MLSSNAGADVDASLLAYHVNGHKAVVLGTEMRQVFDVNFHKFTRLTRLEATWFPEALDTRFSVGVALGAYWRGEEQLVASNNPADGRSADAVTVVSFEDYCQLVFAKLRVGFAERTDGIHDRQWR